MSETSENRFLENNNARVMVQNAGKHDGGPRLGIRSFILSYGMMGFFSWGLYTVIVSQISNIEKAFGLTSAETGWLLTVWEIGYVACVSIAGYFSPKAHIPRVIGFVTFICGIAGIVSALPHFVVFEDQEYAMTTGNISTDGNVDNLCAAKTITTGIPVPEPGEERSVSKKSLAFGLFNLAMVLQGIGKGPCHPYSSQYVDDNAEKSKTGFYMSITWSIAIFGLAVGYGIGSLVSKVYVTLQPTDLTPTDPRFIGAWWLGFVVLGAITIISAVPMFFFPRSMKESGSVAVNKGKQTDRSMAVVVKEMKAVGKTLMEILMTPIYTLTLIGAGTQVLAFATFFGFEPKYMEIQFEVPAWQSNIILGVASIGAYCVGSVVGGYITKKYKMTPYAMFRMVIFLLVLVNVFLIVMIFIGCPTREIYDPLTDTRLDVRLDCDCSDKQFLPICGDDGKNYFSPCHAGCTNGTLLDYSGCSLIPGGTAKAGMCPTGCQMVWPYAVTRFIENFLDAVAALPTFLVFLRSAGEDKKAFAIGLQAAITSLVSWLPGPVVGGKLIDTTCLIWKKASTSGKYCGHYDTIHQRRLLHGLQFGIRCAGLFFLCIAMYKAKKIPDWNTEEKKEADGDSVKEEKKEALVI